MTIKNTEKQILQKYYAERIKSLSQILKDIIQQDKQDVLNETIRKIDEAGLRIVELQSDWTTDNHKASGGLGLLSVIGVAFIILKLCGVIDWSWMWVLAPFWIPLAIILVIVLLVLSWIK